MKRLALACVLASVALTSSATAQSLVSIEGRWTLSTGPYLPGSIPSDLVISVDGDRVYGMLGDFQIRGAVKGSTFALVADWPEHPLTVDGAVQPNGTLGGRLSLMSSPAADGSRLRKNAPWTATRASGR